MPSPVPAPPPRRGLKGYLGVYASGLCMGAADVVPGVSGGTIAFILGIYEEWLYAIRAVDMAFVHRLVTLRWGEILATFPWAFFLALLAGVGTAILTLAKSVTWALENYPAMVWGFFFGLTLASIVVVQRRVQRWTALILLAATLTTIGAYVMVGLVPVSTPETWWFVFLSAVVAICAMVLPGISGAFILVLLGKYHYILEAIVQRNILILAIFGAGCVVGLLSIARLLVWLFRHYHDLTVALLAGFMVGSLRKVWPWKETLSTYLNRHGETVPLYQINILPGTETGEALWVVSLMCLGAVIVYGLDQLVTSRERHGTAP